MRTIGSKAEYVQRFTKGQRVLVIGRREFGEWQTREGETRTSYEIWADDVVSLSPREEGGGPPGAVRRNRDRPKTLSALRSGGRTAQGVGTASALVAAMPEVGLGLGLERFTLLTDGDVYGVVDIVEQDAASIVLTALPDFPLAIGADKARQFVAAWKQQAELQTRPYEVRQEQREV